MTDALDEQLEHARGLGFLGPGPVAHHRAHAEAFAGAIGEDSVDLCVDLGSGGGVPGLVLATLLPQSRWVLLDSMQRRTAFLGEAVVSLGLDSRVEVVTARAEEAGRRPELRGHADVVVARSFGPPAVTAECAAPLLRLGGVLVVSEPPDSTGDRWPVGSVRLLGLGEPEMLPGPPTLVRLRQRYLSAERFPRRTGVPAKRPLW